MENDEVSISEYVSKNSRQKLANLLLDETKKKLEADKKHRMKKRGRPSGDSYLEAGKQIGLSRTGFYKLVHGKTHASTETLDKLIDTNTDLNPTETRRIIDEDLFQSVKAKSTWLEKQLKKMGR